MTVRLKPAFEVQNFEPHELLDYCFKYKGFI